MILGTKHKQASTTPATAVNLPGLWPALGTGGCVELLQVLLAQPKLLIFHATGMASHRQRCRRSWQPSTGLPTQLWPLLSICHALWQASDKVASDLDSVKPLPAQLWPLSLLSIFHSLWLASSKSADDLWCLRACQQAMLRHLQSIHHALWLASHHRIAQILQSVSITAMSRAGQPGQLLSFNVHPWCF